MEGTGFTPIWTDFVSRSRLREPRGDASRLAVRRRRGADEAAELAAEVERVLEAGQRGDLADRAVGGKQEFTDALQAVPQQVLGRRGQ